MLNALKEQVSEKEYLEGELQSDVKHEYIDGAVFAMSGAKANHNRISNNINNAFYTQLRDKSCESFSSDMKVKINSKYFYPDVLVNCSEMKGDDTYTETPTIIVEVLSKPTRKLDKTLKMTSYLQIPTLQEYVMIEQDFVEIEVVRKRNNWQPPEHFYLGDEITFESIGLTLTVEEIYARVDNEDMDEWLALKAAKGNE
jgi:Uma2 family endonuclease